jgi:ferrous iron transport protein A
MGFGEESYVTKVSGNRTILCQVNETRIALSHGAASKILVERIGAR